MKKYISVFASAAVAAAFLVPGLAFADTVGPINFESYSLGTINAQDGWTSLGAAGSGCAVYDHAVASTSTAPISFATKSLRISNAVTSGCFGDQTFSKSLVNAVGESGAGAGTYATGTLQAHFETEFDIASAIPTQQQPGLFMSVSPDRGDGSRMSYLGFSDVPTGIDVIFYDVQGVNVGFQVANFVSTDLGIVSRTAPHHIKMTFDAVDGPSNDVVKVYIDNVLVHTGTSWENYYHFDTEAAAEQNVRIVRNMLFRSGGAPAPLNAGSGFLVDNLSLVSGPTPPSTVTVTINKFIDGSMATAASASSSAFTMNASWNATNIGAGSGSYDLDADGFNGNPTPYQAITSPMTAGASYSTSEVTGGAVAGANCSTGQPYALVGYKVGDDITAAQAAPISTSTPSFTNLTSNKVVLVLNKICVPTPVHLSPANGSTLSSAALTHIDWTDVTDPAMPITYVYQAANSPAINPDGSFVSPVYTSGPLSVSEIPTPGTPAGVYYWHVRAVDADGNMSPWTAAWQVTVDNTPPATFLKVHVLKYLDYQQATVVPGNYQFPMTATWMTANLNGGATTTGAYVLGNNHGGAADLYGADTAAMQSPANYATSEITNDIDSGSLVLPTAAQCAPGKYRLLGYKASATSFADAATQATSTSASFSGLTGDKYVLVYNVTCAQTPTPPANACSLTSAPPGYTLRNGTNGSDTVTLAPFTMFVGKGGNDKITAPDGNYIICTGSGNDTITIGNGDYTIDAGGGNNTITTGNGAGPVTTGNGNDTITTGNGAHAINAGGGNNTITTGNGVQTVTTGSGNDNVTTGSGSDIINVGGGNNTVKAGGGDDTISAGSGNDTIDGGAGTDTCHAGAGTNTVTNCELP